MSYWRTLIDVQRVEGDNAIAVVPGWNPHKEVPIPLRFFPESIRPTSGKPTVFLAEVNLGAEFPHELDPHNFELAPEPVAEEDLG